MRKTRLFWRINEIIHAPRVRVIDEKGKQIGILTLKQALERAKQVKLDLVEIAPKAKPPVTKIVDSGKFRYAQEKKLRGQIKKAKLGEQKEIRLSPFMAENDYQTRRERMKEFLEEKHKVKVVVKFKGRQMGSKQFGYKILKRVLEDFGQSVAVDREPKFFGRHLIMVMSPTPHAKTKN